MVQFAAILAPILFWLVPMAQAAATDLLIVLNKSDHEAVLVEPLGLTITARVPTGKGPHEVAVSPDGRTAYVSNYGVYGVFRQGQQRSEPGNSLTVIDLDRGAATDTIDLGDYTRPHGVQVSRDGAKLWVTCEGAKAVLEISTHEGRIARAWETGQEISHMVVATPDERKLYVANIRSGTVTVIERESNRVTSIATGAGAEGIDVSPDGGEVWVTNRGANTISVITVANDSVIVNFPSGGEMPIRAKFTPDGKEVWVSNARSSSVTVFRADNRERVATIAVGAVPVGIQMAPDGKRAFVACTNDDVVKVMDVRGRRVTKDLHPGNEPDGMAWSDRRAERANAKGEGSK